MTCGWALLATVAASLLQLPGQVTAAEHGFPAAVVARFPHGTYLENLTIAGNGAVLFTNYFNKTIEIWDARAGARTFATLTVHPANIVRLHDGYLVLAHTAKYTDGPAAMRGGNQLLWLDAHGAVKRMLTVPELVFGNGMVPSGSDAVLITDSVRGVVVRVDLGSGASTVWLADPRLAPDPARPRKLAANGLRRGAGAIYVTSSAARSVFRVPVDSMDRPRGALELVAATPGADDMAIGADGTVFLATHGETVVRVRGGRVDTVVDHDVAGCTSVALTRDGRTLYVLGTGGLNEGGTGEATLVRATVTR